PGFCPLPRGEQGGQGGSSPTGRGRRPLRPRLAGRPFWALGRLPAGSYGEPRGRPAGPDPGAHSGAAPPAHVAARSRAVAAEPAARRAGVGTRRTAGLADRKSVV